jgi:hypothetical protein
MQNHFKNYCSLILIIISLLFLLVVNVIKAQGSNPYADLNTWIDPERDGNNSVDLVKSSVEDTIVKISLPFIFDYSETAYTECYASSKGTISFSKLTNTKAPQALIGGFFGDIQLEYACPPSSWKYEMIGISPYRCFAITWKGFIRINGSCGQYVSFQVKLFETTNIISTVAFENNVASSAIYISPDMKNEEMSSSQKTENKTRTEENTWTLY